MWRQYLYLGILAVYGAALIACRREKLPEGMEASSIRQPFCRLSAWILRRMQAAGGGRRFFRRSREDLVGKELILLDPPRGETQRQLAYTTDKLATALIFGILASFLALAVCSSEQENAEIVDGRYITRNGYEGTARDVTVIASENELGERRQLGEYVVHVEPRQYSTEQAAEKAEEAAALLPAAIRGENPDLDHVNHRLDLVRVLDGYPFRISWESSDYGVIDADGMVMTEAMDDPGGQEEDPGGQQVTLRARLSYGEFSYETSIPVRVIPADQTMAEREQKGISMAIEESERNSREDAELVLPSRADGVSLEWREPEEETDAVIFFLVLAAGVLCYVLNDRKIHEQAQKRSRQMQLDYPQVVSKMALFLGAGMSIRSVFRRLGQEYVQKERKEGEKRYVYEEILLVCHELESGVSEQEAYAHFGRRCGLREYTKLCSLLSQNLRKGNSELLRVLQGEAEEASEQRRQMARQLGEEAGTKLLAPMMLMLIITLVIIIIPAFFGFSV